MLIDNFKAQPSLWDVSLKEYHLRDVKNGAFKEISEDMDISVPELKAKWNSLRSQELHERTKEEKSKSGMGADELYLSNWQFMSKMRFVGQCKKTAKSASTLKLSTIISGDDLFEIDHEIDHESIEVPPKKQKPASAKRKSLGLTEDATAKKNVLLISCIEAMKQTNYIQRPSSIDRFLCHLCRPAIPGSRSSSFHHLE